MIESKINGQEILEETEHIASTEEIHDYAKMIGIDPDTEQDLMYLAREGIDAPLPLDWKACRNENSEIYYFNFSTGISLWDHPMDQHYKDLVIKERQNRRSVKLLKDISQKDNLSNLPNSKSYKLNNMDINELKIVPDSKTKQFYHAESNESDSQSSECNLSTESKSEDYGRGIDFGLDKSITDRLSHREPYPNTFGSSMNKSNNTQLSNTNSSLLKSNDQMDKQKKTIDTLEEKEDSELKVSDDESKIKTITISDKDSNSKNELIEEIEENLNHINELEQLKEDVNQKITKEIENFEQTEYEKMRQTCEDRLNHKKQLLENKFEQEKQEIIKDYSDKTELLKNQLENEFQTNISQITQQFHIEDLDIVKNNHQQILDKLEIKLLTKLDDITQQNDQKIAELQSQYEQKIEQIQSDQEELLLSNRSELKQLKHQHKTILDQLDKEKQSAQAQIDMYEAQKKSIKQSQAELLTSGDNSLTSLSNREIKYTESLRKVKMEYNDVKRELMESKSELEALKHEIVVLKNDKQKLTQQIQLTTEQLMSKQRTNIPAQLRSKDSYDSAVLIDDLIVSNSFETPIIHESSTKLTLSQDKQQLIMKAKQILSQQSIPSNVLVKSKSISLPSLHNLESSSYFQKSHFTHEPTNMQHKVTSSSIITTDYVDSLQKITSDLNNIVESLKSDCVIQNSTKSIAFCDNNDRYINSNLYKNSQNDFEKSLQSKYNKVFNRNNNSNTNNYFSGVSINSISGMSSNSKIRSSKYLELFNNQSNTEDRLKQHKNWLTNFKLKSSISDI